MVRIASHAFRQIARTALVGGVLLLASVPGAFAQSGGHGSNTDSVTGWRCSNAFCDTIVAKFASNSAQGQAIRPRER